MKVLVVGATGATGKLLVDQLLKKDIEVKAIVRSPEKLVDQVGNPEGLEIIRASIIELNEAGLAEIVKDCHAVASCLGHNINFKGLFGKPRKLVRDSVMNICRAIEHNEGNSKTRFVLMNTTGNRNRDLKEHRSIGERLVVLLLRLLLPPHPDNEKAAEFLRVNIGQNHKNIEWVAVRPDTLIDEEKVSPYSDHPSPVRSPIFNAGKTSRTNVAHFMKELIVNDELWSKWKGQMPVIYNQKLSKED